MAYNACTWQPGTRANGKAARQEDGGTFHFIDKAWWCPQQYNHWQDGLRAVVGVSSGLPLPICKTDRARRVASDCDTLAPPSVCCGSGRLPVCGRSSRSGKYMRISVGASKVCDHGKEGQRVTYTSSPRPYGHQTLGDTSSNCIASWNTSQGLLI